MRQRHAMNPCALALCVLAACLGVACGERSEAPRASRVTVFAAASLADAFREIGAAFEGAHPGTTVEFSFAGSNHLRTHLENGARADVFASADRTQMDAAVASGVVDASTVRVLAMNTLALIVPRTNPAGIAGLADLARPGVRIVVADQAVPVGGYTRRMLDSVGAAPGFGPAFVAAFDANTVSREQSVSAVVAKVSLGEGDAGIAYASDGAGASGERILIIPLPEEFDHRGEYLIAVTERAEEPGIGAEFLALCGSGEGAAILTKRGFLTPAPGSP